MKYKIRIAALMLAVACMQTAMAELSPLVSKVAEYVYPKNHTLSPPHFTYAPDGNGYLLLSPDGTTIDRYDTKSGEKIETIFDVARTRETEIPSIQGFEISDNGNYLLVYTDAEYIYRRSFTAKYYVYEVRTRLMYPLSTEFNRQQSPLMSPDGLMVAFVADNNIYIRKNVYKSQVAVTTDGERNKIINGIPDWVYEEEFSTNMSMAWSPDNTMLCYIKYDESEVPLYHLPIYQGTCDPKDQYAYYPGVYSYKYPVAGEKNSVVSVHAYDIDTRKTKDIDLNGKGVEYIPRIDFGKAADRLMISTLNRDQNHFEIFCTNPKSTIAKSVYVEDNKAWVDPLAYENLTYLDESFLVLSTRSGYSHIYQYSYSGSLLKSWTSGDYDVTSCYGMDAKGSLYYQSAQPTPLDRIVTKIDAKGKSTVISKGAGTTRADFSPDMTFAMMEYSDLTTAPLFALCTNDGKQLRVLQDNAACAKRYANVPKKEFFTFDSDGYKLNGYMILPAGASATNKCPVIMEQYSGPGSQSVLNKWGVDWYYAFVEQGYAVVCVDGRGTGGRGRAFCDVVYKDLGHYETIDQVNAARYIARQPWADASRIGIYGWSYGGYEALMAASADDCPYAAVVAVAPVTNWRYYDTIYTERYMLTPQQNDKGYFQSAPINKVLKLACPALLMYGTSDDNVHPVNTLQYVSMLESCSSYCDVLPFPNMNHSIYGCNSRAIVYAKMLDYFNLRLNVIGGAR